MINPLAIVSPITCQGSRPDNAKADRCVVSHGSSLTAVRPRARAMPTDPPLARLTRRPSNHLPTVAPRAELSDKTKYVQVGREKFSALTSQTSCPVGEAVGQP